MQARRTTIGAGKPYPRSLNSVNSRASPTSDEGHHDECPGPSRQALASPDASLDVADSAVGVPAGPGRESRRGHHRHRPVAVFRRCRVERHRHLRPMGHARVAALGCGRPLADRCETAQAGEIGETQVAAEARSRLGAERVGVRRAELDRLREDIESRSTTDRRSTE